MNIEQFIRKYEPIWDEDLDAIRQFDWTVEHEWNEILKAHKEGKVCTVVETEDDEMVLINGLHYVNRMFYIITKHVIEETDLNIIY